MPAFLSRSVILGVLMLAAALITVAITPRAQSGSAGRAPDLEVLIPETFGVWSLDAMTLPLIVPESTIADGSERIYGEVLNRTYINGSGERIMLTIAWGGNQSDALSVHRPEVCYTAQGFSVTAVRNHELNISGRVLSMKRLNTQNGRRYEPVSYWIVIGDQVVNSRLQRKLAQLRYGLSGTIPDGVLVRVSSIGRDEEREYLIQDTFIRDLYNGSGKNVQELIMGRIQPDEIRADRKWLF